MTDLWQLVVASMRILDPVVRGLVRDMGYHYQLINGRARVECRALSWLASKWKEDSSDIPVVSHSASLSQAAREDS